MLCADIGLDLYLREFIDIVLLLARRGGGWSWLGPTAGFARIMDIIRIIFRLLVNLAKDLPLTPRKLHASIRRRRRTAAWRLRELERLDRIRNPSKYKPV